jgi:hypothetical protein
VSKQAFAEEKYRLLFGKLLCGLTRSAAAGKAVPACGREILQAAGFPVENLPLLGETSGSGFGGRISGGVLDTDNEETVRSWISGVYATVKEMEDQGQKDALIRRTVQPFLEPIMECAVSGRISDPAAVSELLAVLKVFTSREQQQSALILESIKRMFTGNGENTLQGTKAVRSAA